MANNRVKGVYSHSSCHIPEDVDERQNLLIKMSLLEKLLKLLRYIIKFDI